MALFRHPNRPNTYHKATGQLTILHNVSRAASNSGYKAPSPKTVLVRVKGRQEPFDPNLLCYWMNGKGRPNVYFPLEV